MTLFEKIENKKNHKKDAPQKEHVFNPKIWADMSMDEKQIYKLYEAFQKHTNKRGVKNKWLPSIYVKTIPDEDDMKPADLIRQADNWKYFKECWELYLDDENFDINNFMDSVFRNLGKDDKIFPTQLRTKKIMQQYKDYRVKLKMTKTVSTEKKMMQDLANTYKFMRNRIEDDSVWEWFNTPKKGQYISDGVLCTIQEMISPFYYSISKSFIKAYYNLDKDIQEEIIEMQELHTIQSLVKIKSSVYTFAKELFGDDII